MARRLVKYNGEITRNDTYSPHSQVIGDRLYEIVDEEISTNHTKYKLKGLSGKFDSIWFDDVDSTFPTYFAFSYRNIPELGKSFENFYRFTDTGDVLCMVRTSPVQRIEKVAKDVYKIYTLNSIYFVQVK